MLLRICVSAKLSEGALLIEWREEERERERESRSQGYGRKSLSRARPACLPASRGLLSTVERGSMTISTLMRATEEGRRIREIELSLLAAYLS